jgi:hypothetical protein
VDITIEQVKALRDEAGQAGDLEQVATCDGALAGEPGMWEACESIIAFAAAEGE